MTSYSITPGRAENITESLLRWYKENKRDLPWRHTQDAYAVWISEVMAQQTRIAYLLAYYERFIQLFPTVDSLAQAEEADVLKVWEGLGYYTRARNLQRAAKKITRDFNSQLPRTREELLTLPGIGEYTAGAILSIAYEIPTPAVDGNVLRVFARLENSDEDVMLPQTKKRAAAFVSSIMPTKHVSYFTQALMELGALVCTPKNPDCSACPIQDCCWAQAHGQQYELPKKSVKRSPKSLKKTIIIIRSTRGEILMRQRTEALLSGLWELYRLDEALSAPQAEAHLQSLGFILQTLKSAGQAKHVFTHQIWHMHGYECTVSGQCVAEGYHWIPKEDIKKLAVPTAIRFYIKQI
ncbi:MAG: A/G-specific adenine glycosylase [Oscillospiraceae bacterium]|jgi:A/G-specific adenine glycosylase|nr:A/G-specific adenine glycosylase [Oscillospiraceae bacterium]